MQHLNTNWQSNPAIKALIDDYAKYHAVLAIVGSLVLIVILALTVFFWIKFAKIQKIGRFKWPFDKKVYFSFGLLLTIFSLFFALVVAANISTALKPIPGFTTLASSTSTASDSKVGIALNEWVQSGKSALPSSLKQKAQERVSWQRPKAIICGLLLIVFVLVNLRVWGYLIKARAQSETKWSIKEIIILVGGTVSVAITLLLVIMFIANTQGAIAPLAISLLGAGG